MLLPGDRSEAWNPALQALTSSSLCSSADPTPAPGPGSHQSMDNREHGPSFLPYPLPPAACPLKLGSRGQCPGPSEARTLGEVPRKVPSEQVPCNLTQPGRSQPCRESAASTFRGHWMQTSEPTRLTCHRAGRLSASMFPQCLAHQVQ